MKNLMDKNSQKWTIVVGATGFVGSYVSAELTSHFKVIKTSRSRHAGFTQFDMAKDNILDLVSQLPGSMKDVNIILCNKFGPMENYAFDEDFARKCEVDSVVRIAEDCKKLDIPIVYLSTSYVYPGDRSGYEESSPVGPISLYGRLKRDAELELLKNNKRNLILRLDKVVGASFKDSHLFTEWYNSASNGYKIRCIKGQRFSPTSVKDVAVAVNLSIENKLAGIYHCVNSEIWQRSDLAKFFLETMGIDTAITEESLKELGLREKRPICSNLNSQKLIDAVGIEFTPMAAIITNLKKFSGDLLC